MKSQESNSQKISTEEILNEIAPLIKEYFVVTCEKHEDRLVLHFLNGQTFHIRVTE